MKIKGKKQTSHSAVYNGYFKNITVWENCT